MEKWWDRERKSHTDAIQYRLVSIQVCSRCLRWCCTLCLLLWFEMLLPISLWFWSSSHHSDTHTHRKQSNWTPVILLAVLFFIFLFWPFALKLRALIGVETKSETLIQHKQTNGTNCAYVQMENGKKFSAVRKTFWDHKIPHKVNGTENGSEEKKIAKIRTTH